MGVKAFELVSAIENVVDRSNDRDGGVQNVINCVECFQDTVLIGTSCGHLIRYAVDVRTVGGGRIEFNSYRQKQKTLVARKSIDRIAVSLSLKLAVILSDSTIVIVHLDTLEVSSKHAKLKSISTFCTNESDEKSNPFALEVCVVPMRKRCLQLYNITDEKCILRKEISLSEIPIEVRMDGFYLCVALQTKYVIVDYENGTTIELFPFDGDTTMPIIRRIAKAEFLLSGPSGLGMFVTAAGISQRPPLSWRDEGTSLRDAAYIHPYVISLDDQFISVHSFLDQQQKQAMSFVNGRMMRLFKGRLLIASHREIFALAPVHWEKQVQSLLSEEAVEEALTIAGDALKSSEDKVSASKTFSIIQQRAGFIKFAQCQFAESEELFVQGNLDPRELLSLYEGLLADEVGFVRTGGLHQYASLRQMAGNVAEKEMLYQKSVLHYLETVRSVNRRGTAYKEVELALLKLYAESDSPKLPRLVETFTTSDQSDVSILSVDQSNASGLSSGLTATTAAQQCVDVLSRFGRYHCLARLHLRLGEHREAVDLWTKLACKDLSDAAFGGLDYLVDVMRRIPVQEYTWSYLPALFKLDQELVIQVFTKRWTLEGRGAAVPSATSAAAVTGKFDSAEFVIDRLTNKYLQALKLYLEYLVFELKKDSEQVHTYLARLYQEETIRLLSADGNQGEVELQEGRKKLQDFLRSSDHYQVQLILGKMELHDSLLAERAILYGKLEQHQRALSILVHDLRDYMSAQDYCRRTGEGRPEPYRRKLYEYLLHVYLDPANGDQEALVGPAVELLNSPFASFNGAMVFELIPTNWPVSLVRRFLLQATRSSLHSGRIQKIGRSLAQSENNDTKQALREKRKKMIIIGDDRVCDVCHRGFAEVSFLHLPSGAVTHTHCVKSTQS